MSFAMQVLDLPIRVGRFYFLAALMLGLAVCFHLASGKWASVKAGEEVDMLLFSNCLLSTKAGCSPSCVMRVKGVGMAS